MEMGYELSETSEIVFSSRLIATCKNSCRVVEITMVKNTQNVTLDLVSYVANQCFYINMFKMHVIASKSCKSRERERESV